MNRYLAGGLAAVLTTAGIAGGLIAGLLASAPVASAGCQDNPLLYFPTAQKCDGPIQPNGSWQRCVIYYYQPPQSPPSQTDCHQMGGPDPHYPPSPPHSFYQPPSHIDP